MFDNILRIIQALITVSFVGLIIYFRKPLKSVLYAIGDTDMLKVGWLEFKRRKAINKVVKDIDKAVAVSKSVAASISASSNISGSISSEPKLLSVRIQQLEEENASLKHQVLGLAAVVASRRTLDPEVAENIKKIAKHYYKEALAIDPKSKFLENVSKLLDLTTGDRIGVGEDIKVGVVGKAAVNASDEIPPEESQQSKP